VIFFGARESGFGRGFDDVDVLVFDEAQIMTDKALQNMIPTQNAVANALLLFLGTPPKPEDPSEVFSELRRGALDGSDKDVVFVEISADPVPEGVDPMAWVRDPAQWARGNPAYRTGRTGRTAMLRMTRMLTLQGPEGMLREGLGVWDDDAAAAEPIPMAWWMASLVPEAKEEADQIASDFTVCVSATRDRRWVYVARCGERADGWRQVELVAKLRGEDVAGWLMERRGRIREVTGQAKGAGLTSELLAQMAGDPKFKVKTVPWGGPELVEAYGRGMDALEGGQVKTLSHPDLNGCVPLAVWKGLGGGRVVDGAKSHGEMAALNAWFGAFGMRTRFTKPVVALPARSRAF
jgi:hypothetical protein